MNSWNFEPVYQIEGKTKTSNKWKRNKEKKKKQCMKNEGFILLKGHIVIDRT